MDQRDYLPGRHYPLYALTVLLLMNLSNYADRQALHSLERPIIEQFAIGEGQFAALATAFVVAYSLCALPLGFLSDRWVRKNVIAAGVVLWSLATVSCAFCRTYNELFVARALTGIGEATCVPSALAMISDYFPRTHRGKAMAAFAGAMFIGGALGYYLGGVFASETPPCEWLLVAPWRRTFLLLGPPGLLLGWLAYRLVEPRRGATEEVAPVAHGRIRGRDIGTIVRIPTFVVFTLSSVFFYFALGALQVFAPRFLRLHKGLDIRVGAVVLSAVALPAAALGLPSAGAAADWLSRRRKSGALLTVMVGTLLAAPCALVFLVAKSPGFYGSMGFLAAYFLCFTAVPAAVVVHSVVEPEARATAMGVFTLATHLLGDSLGPRVAGSVSDALQNLGEALTFVVPTSLLVSGVVAALALPLIGRDIDAMNQRMYQRSGQAPGAEQEDGQSARR